MPANAAFHQTLLAMCHERSPSDVAPVLEPLMAQGLVNLEQPLPSPYHRSPDEPFLTQWLASLKPDQLEADDLARIAQWRGSADAWARPYREGTLLDHWMGTADRRPSASLAPFITAQPRAAWAQFLPRARYHQDDGAVAPYVGLMRWVLANEPNEGEGRLRLSEHLAEAGFPLTGADEDGPIARWIRTPGQWQAFLAQGGDPTQAVTLDNKTDPLWQRLIDRQAALRPLIQAWAKADPALARAEETQAIGRYFDNLKSYDVAGQNKALTAHPAWVSLTDPLGRNPLMVLLGANGSSAASHSVLSRAAQIKKAAPLFQATDHEGRSLWHYLLRTGPYNADPAADLQKTLLAMGTPLTLDRHGRGLLLQGLSPSSPQPEHVYDPRLPMFTSTPTFNVAWANPRIAQALARPHLWLAGPAAEQATVQAALLGRDAYTSLGGFPQVLHRLAEALVESGEVISPAWRGVFVVNAFHGPNVTTSQNQAFVRQQLAQGAIFDLPPAVEATFRTAFAKRPDAMALFDEALAASAQAKAIRTRAADRQAELETAPAPATRRRFRA